MVRMVRIGGGGGEAVLGSLVARLGEAALDGAVSRVYRSGGCTADEVRR